MFPRTKCTAIAVAMDQSLSGITDTHCTEAGPTTLEGVIATTGATCTVATTGATRTDAAEAASVGGLAAGVVDTVVDGKTTSAYDNRLSALLCLLILQLTLRSTLPINITTEYLFCPLWRSSKRLCCVLYSAKLYYNRLSALLGLSILQPILHCCTLPVDITTDYPLCSLYGASPTD
jgi:hypothetical protein